MIWYICISFLAKFYIKAVSQFLPKIPFDMIYYRRQKTSHISSSLWKVWWKNFPWTKRNPHFLKHGNADFLGQRMDGCNTMRWGVYPLDFWAVLVQTVKEKSFCRFYFGLCVGLTMSWSRAPKDMGWCLLSLPIVHMAYFLSKIHGDVIIIFANTAEGT